MRITSEVMVTRSLDRLQARLPGLRAHPDRTGDGSPHPACRPTIRPAPAGSLSLHRCSLQAREQELRQHRRRHGLARHRRHAAADRVRAAATRPRARDPWRLVQDAERAPGAGPGDAPDHRGDRRHRQHQAPRTALFGGFSGGAAVTKSTPTAPTRSGRHRRPDDAPRQRHRAGPHQRDRRPSGSATAPGTRDNPSGLLDCQPAELEAGDSTASLSARLTDLDTAAARIGDGLSRIGAATNRVESAEGGRTARILTLRTELSQVQDVDIAEGIDGAPDAAGRLRSDVAGARQGPAASLVAFLR